MVNIELMLITKKILKERLERVGCRSILLPPVFRVS